MTEENIAQARTPILYIMVSTAVVSHHSSAWSVKRAAREPASPSHRGLVPLCPYHSLETATTTKDCRYTSVSFVIRSLLYCHILIRCGLMVTVSTDQQLTSQKRSALGPVGQTYV